MGRGRDSRGNHSFLHRRNGNDGAWPDLWSWLASLVDRAVNLVSHRPVTAHRRHGSRVKAVLIGGGIDRNQIGNFGCRNVATTGKLCRVSV